MAEQNIDIVVRGKDVTREAFKNVEEGLGGIDKKAQGTTESMKKTGASFGDIAKASAIVAGAVTGVAVGIAALGSRGADVLDIKDSFASLNKTIGNDSTAVLGTLKTAFAGTISDFDIMKMSNAALSSGLKISNEDFGMLGNAARVLADRTGTDVTTAFNTLSGAMATGKTKGAEMLVGVIDNKKAADDYATSLGKLTKDLTEQEKIDANAIAIKAQLKISLAGASGATADFADKVEQSKVKISNLVDGIGEWVATSPGLGTFASAVTGVAGPITALAVSMGPIKAMLPLLIGSFSSAIPLLGGFAAAAWPIAAAGAAIFGAWKIGNIDAVQNKIAEWTLRLGGMDAAQAKAAVSATANGVAAAKQAQSTAVHTVATSAAATAMDKASAAAIGESVALSGGQPAMEAAIKASKDLTEWKEKQAGAYRAFKNEMGVLEIEEAGKAQKRADDLRDLDRKALDFMLQDARDMQAKKLADLDASALIYMQHEKTLADEGVQNAKNALALKDEAAKNYMANELVLLKEHAEKAKTTVGGIFSSMPDVIMGAFMGGGNVGKSIGGHVFGKLFEPTGPLGSIFSKGGDFFGKLIGGNMGKKLGETFGSLAGPLGTLLGGMAGDLIGPLISKVGGFFKNLFGGPSGIEVEGRKTAQSFRDQIALTLTGAQKAEAGTDEWKKSVIGVRDAYIAAGKTEQEALDIMDRLWKAEKAGGKEVAAVIAEIEANMKTLPPVMGETETSAAKIVREINQLAPGLTATQQAAAKTKEEFEGITLETQFMKDQFEVWKSTAEKPVLSEWLTVHTTINRVLTEIEANSGRDWQSGQRTMTAEEKLAAFLLKNPGDRDRAAAAIQDDHRKDAAQKNIPGAAYGGILNMPVSGGLALLHGREAVIPLDRPSAIGTQLARDIALYAGKTDNGRVDRLEASIERLVQTVATMPAVFAASQRDAILMSGGRR